MAICIDGQLDAASVAWPVSERITKGLTGVRSIAEDSATLATFARLVRGGEPPAELVRELRDEVKRGIYEVPLHHLVRDIVDFHRGI